MATKSLNNPFALLESVGDDDVPKPLSAVKKQTAKQTPKQQEPPKPKGPVVGSELKEAKPKQPKQQQKPAEDKNSNDTPKEEQFQKVPEKKKNTDHDGQRAPRKQKEHRSRHGEGGEKSGQYGSGANRVFEKKSGTGRGHENKKGGAGKGNWGKIGDELHVDIKEAQATHEHVEVSAKVSVVESPPTEQPATAPPADAAPATTTAPAEQTSTTVTPVIPATTTDAKEVDNTVSYSEWLKKNEKASEVPLPRALRTAGEGIEDTSGWAKIEVTRPEDKLVIVAKKEDKKEKQPVKEKKEEKKENKKPAAAVPLDKVFNVTVKVEEKEDRIFKKGPRGDKEGKGGKGRGRGKRAGAGVSSPNRIQNANKKQEEFNLVHDAFPSLSPTQAKHAEVSNPTQATTPATTPAATTQQTTPPNPAT